MAKTRVERCLTISIGDVVAQRDGISRGKVLWEWFGGITSSVAFETNWLTATPTVTFQYADDEYGNGLVRLKIDLQASFLCHGGKRWWLSCPITRDGKTCNRRCGTLHLPPHHEFFGCRLCHNLAYESSQQAHQYERLITRITESRG